MTTPRTELDFAILFHETYERLAPSFGYETRPDTRAFDPESKNGRLMLAVMREVAMPLASDLAAAQEARQRAEEAESALRECMAQVALAHDAINDALPWMIKLGDYIGNGTQADPMGRCNAILKMRIAVEKRDD